MNNANTVSPNLKSPADKINQDTNYSTKLREISPLNTSLFKIELFALIPEEESVPSTASIKSCTYHLMLFSTV